MRERACLQTLIITIIMFIAQKSVQSRPRSGSGGSSQWNENKRYTTNTLDASLVKCCISLCLFYSRDLLGQYISLVNS